MLTHVRLACLLFQQQGVRFPRRPDRVQCSERVLRMHVPARSHGNICPQQWRPPRTAGSYLQTNNADGWSVSRFYVSLACIRSGTGSSAFTCATRARVPCPPWRPAESTAAHLAMLLTNMRIGAVTAASRVAALLGRRHSASVVR